MPASYTEEEIAKFECKLDGILSKPLPADGIKLLAKRDELEGQLQNFCSPVLVGNDKQGAALLQACSTLNWELVMQIMENQLSSACLLVQQKSVSSHN